MDLTTIFCTIDDFCQTLEIHSSLPALEGRQKHRHRNGTLSLSEVMTILVWFHRSEGYRHFKGYYQQCICKTHQSEFPNLVSYQRFIELNPRSLYHLGAFLKTRQGEQTGIYFVDSTPIKVCHNLRIRSHQVFQTVAGRGKSSMGWFYGLKLHLVINEQGEFLAGQLTSGNTDDRKPIPQMVQDLQGKLFGDKGYISKKLTQLLKKQGLEFITKIRKNMKKQQLALLDNILLRKRALVETVNDQLKNISQIEHSRHRSVIKALAHITAGVIAYTFQEKKPKIQWTPQEEKFLQFLWEQQYKNKQQNFIGL